jgi:hypothetical protein
LETFAGDRSLERKFITKPSRFLERTRNISKKTWNGSYKRYFVVRTPVGKYLSIDDLTETIVETCPARYRETNDFYL